MNRAQRLAVLVSGATVVVVVIVVLVFGVVAPPPVPPLAGGTELPQPVAVLTPEGGDVCVTVVARSGARTRGACVEDGGAHLRVSAEHGLVLERFAGDGSVWMILDPTTGEATRTIEAPYATDQPLSRERPGIVMVEEEGDEVVVRFVDDDRTTEVVRIEAPSGYRLDVGDRASTGDWALITDSSDRVLAARLDGGGAWLLLDEGRSPVWVPAGAARPG